MNAEYLAQLQRRLGNTSVGPSTSRGMGPKGTIRAARDFLSHLDLRRFEVGTESEFLRILDTVTEELLKSMPIGAQHWGSARKFVNIFLRGCVYNRHICLGYKLARTEKWLEVPLDSHVAAGLRNLDDRTDLPRWQTVIGLYSGYSGGIRGTPHLIPVRH
jgi:hypothetical protein